MHAFIHWLHVCVHPYTHIHIYIHTCMHAYMFVVNFHALAQASDFRIERRQVPFLWWNQDSNPGDCETHSPADPMPSHKPSEISRIKQNLNSTARPNDERASLASLPVGFCTWLYRYTCLLLLMLMLWHRQANFESKGDKLPSSGETRIRTRVSEEPVYKCNIFVM